MLLFYAYKNNKDCSIINVEIMLLVRRTKDQ